MDTSIETRFFQHETKFVIGKIYETLRVKSPPYNGIINIETCDEIGTIIPNSEKLLGQYVLSVKIGYGDNGTRCDTFLNDKGEQINHYLDYDGTTRFREVVAEK
jgi:hypothetical protein